MNNHDQKKHKLRIQTKKYRRHKELFHEINKPKGMISNKKICIVLSYIARLIISDFAFLVGIPLGITSSDIGLNVFCNNCNN